MGHLIVELNNIAAGSTQADIRKLLMPDRERWPITHMKLDPLHDRVLIRFWNNTHASACIKEFKRKGYDIRWASNVGDWTLHDAMSSRLLPEDIQRDAQPKNTVFISGLPARTTHPSVLELVEQYGPVSDVRLIANGTRAFVDFRHEVDGIRCIAELARISPYSAAW
jgi:hypothetical protein